MTTIPTELAALLSRVQRPGDYCVAGTEEIFAPGLVVDGVGPIALPLLPAQAEALVAMAEPAPYGRGEQTLHDEAVRRTWQIGADKLRFTGRHWPTALAAMVERAAVGLGVSGPVEAELYKLLVYDEGCFFVSHRDTEKAAGMFATLVIVLPSVYEGGSLILRHQEREVRLELGSSDPSEAAFAAFYADCRHEVLPITSGCRLTLIYNLLRAGPAPQPPSYQAEEKALAELLRRWAMDPAGPAKMIYPLEYAYTPAELGFDALKGADAAVAPVLVAAARQADCEVRLALLSIEESGTAEYLGDYGRRRRGSDDEDEFEVGEVYDRSETLSAGLRPDGSPWEMGELPVEEGEVAPPDALDDVAPDEECFHEATGNEGATFERSYRRAVLVLWPRARQLAVLDQGGLPSTLPALADLLAGWRETGDEAIWREALALAAQMLRSWQVLRFPRPGEQGASRAARMLGLLTELSDQAQLEIFLTDVAAAGEFITADVPAVLAALARLAPELAAGLAERLVLGNREDKPSACAALLALGRAQGFDWRPAATAMVAGLPGDPAVLAKLPAWQQPSPVEAGFVMDLLAALPAIDGSLVERVVDILLARPKTYPLDGVLVPAMLRLAEPSPAATRLRDVCLAHLRARIAEPLAPPTDWTRPASLTCDCPRCAELGRFLADPGQETWVLKAAQHERSHVENTIRSSRSDVDTTTEKRGSPHRLIATKNQASYHRRVQQRRKDLVDLAGLEG